MRQSFMDILLTDAVAKAVCWTLVHSLWQGLIAALVAGACAIQHGEKPMDTNKNDTPGSGNR